MTNFYEMEINGATVEDLLKEADVNVNTFKED